MTEHEKTPKGGAKGGADSGKEDKKPLRLSRPGRLQLKKTVEKGQVRQSFSHGRSKAVTVEVKRSRTYTRGAGGKMTEVKDAPLPPEAEAPKEKTPVAAPPSPATTGGGRRLTEEERALRARVLQEAIEEEERASEVVEEIPEGDLEEAPEDIAADAAADTAKVAPAEMAQEAAPAPAAADISPSPEDSGKDKKAARAKTRDEEDEEESRRKGKGKGPEQRKPLSLRRGEQRRRTGKIHVTAALEGDDEERVRSLASVRRARERERERQRVEAGQVELPTKIVRDVVIPETITVQELANRMAERAADVIKQLMKMGVIATITQSIDGDTAELVVEEFGHRVKRVSESDVEIGLKGKEDDSGDLQPRCPVVTIMGHVDHGKTTLLDALRRTDVAAHEAGGITQHIGAYQVELQSGAKITFLDTPGHEAFSAMRARGANVTDIVVLVVAADDGIMAQTVEAIRHAQAAKVPIIVAINKMDKPDADPQRVKNELLQHNILLEEHGGDVQVVEVSATEPRNLDKLEEAILLQAEILELKANPARAAEGTVVEARLERGRGAVATVLIERGTIRVGDIFVSGVEWGRARALVNDKGKEIKEANPGTPVEVLGLNGVPEAGDDFIVIDNEGRAREITEYRQRQLRDAKAAGATRGSLEQMLADMGAGDARELAVLIKADVQGSAEALSASLQNLSTDEVKVHVLHSAVGGINESDVTLAAASKALIIGFNVRANPQARELARRDGIDIRYYSIIYEVIDDARTMLSGLLSPELSEEHLGNAEIRNVFSISKIGRVAGCMVTEGLVRRGARARLLRDNVVVYEGQIGNLKRFKDDAREVKEGYECGISFENYDDVREGDVIECFEVKETARSL